MKRIQTCTVMTALLSLALVTASFAQATMSSNMYRASKIVGADVENPQGQDLGDIEDVVFDGQTGRIAYAVLAFGGFLGLGEKYHAIPWEALKPAAGQRPGDRERYILNVDQERLRNAPSFDRNTWPDMADRTWGEKLFTYYGVTPYWTQREAQLRDATPAMDMSRSAVVAATVQNIDQNSKLIRFKTANDEIVEMQAPAAMLNTLQAGDRVEVVIRKDMVQKPAAGQPGNMPPGTGTAR